MKVLKMHADLFVQRKRVIAMLYEAKRALNCELPRIKVRIVDYEKEINTLGKCFINKNYITVSKELTDWNDDYLRHVVFHELAHAYFNAKHNEKCPLMHPIVSIPGSKKVLTNALLSYMIIELGKGEK